MTLGAAPKIGLSVAAEGGQTGVQLDIALVRGRGAVVPFQHPPSIALVLYRVVRMRSKAKGHSASPRAALDLFTRIQKHTARIGNRTFNGTSKTTLEELDLFDALSLPKPT